MTPSVSTPLYWDANAGVPAHAAALESYSEASKLYGNPSSAHCVGRDASDCLEGARQALLVELALPQGQLIFTSGGTEANNLAILGVLGALRFVDNSDARVPHVVTTAIEHPSVIATLRDQERRGRVTLTCVPACRAGTVDVAEVLDALTPSTRLVSIIAASNETGVLQPVEAIAVGLKQHAAVLHVDAVQAVAHHDIAADLYRADLLSFSGHKFGSVAGVGALWVAADRGLAPQLRGGAHEGGRRAGTENVAGAASMAAALRYHRQTSGTACVASRRDAFETALSDKLQDIEIIGAHSPRLPNTSSVRFEGCAGDGLLMALDLAGISVSTGSACSSGSVDPSPVLLGMGISKAHALQTLRFSLPLDATNEDMDRVVDETVSVVQRMRG